MRGLTAQNFGIKRRELPAHGSVAEVLLRVLPQNPRVELVQMVQYVGQRRRQSSFVAGWYEMAAGTIWR